MSLDVSTTIADYVAFITPRKACQPAIDILKNMPVEYVYIKDITTYINEGKTSWKRMWTYWTLLDHGDQMTVALQELFLKRITSPIEAFHAYVKLSWLTDKMDSDLEPLFEGKLPKAEERLASGEIVSAKNG